MSQKPIIYDLTVPSASVVFDVEAFDTFILQNGVPFVHYKAIPCPIGVTDEYDIHSHAEHDNCSNGFLYEEAGVCTSLFSGNQNAMIFEDMGIVDGNTVQVTLPRFYDDTDKQVVAQAYDRFFIKDYTAYSTTSQKFEYNQSGFNKLRFNALHVETLIDSHGEKYIEGVDFEVKNGGILWTGARRPGFDPKLEKGTVCSVRYSYRPFYYIKQLLHEVRVAKRFDDITGETTLVRYPQGAILQREWIFENEARSAKGTEDDRDTRAPRRKGYGGR